MHPGLGGVEALLVGPDLPGEDDLLARLGGDGAAEVGLLTVGNEVLPGLDDLQATVLLEDLRPVLRPLAVGFHPVLGDRDHKAGDVHYADSFK
jgi:hypothetical protein